MNGLGSVLGPLVGTSIMRRFDLDGVLYMMAAAAGVLAVFAPGRSLSAPSPPLQLAWSFKVLAPELASLAHDMHEGAAAGPAERRHAAVESRACVGRAAHQGLDGSASASDNRCGRRLKRLSADRSYRAKKKFRRAPWKNALSMNYILYSYLLFKNR